MQVQTNALFAAFLAVTPAVAATQSGHSSSERDALVAGLSEALCARPWTVARPLLTPFADCTDCDKRPELLFASRLANVLKAAENAPSADLVSQLNAVPAPPAKWLKCAPETVLAELAVQVAPKFPAAPADADQAAICAGLADAVLRLDSHRADAEAARKACVRVVMTKADADATAAIRKGQLDTARSIAERLKNGPAGHVEMISHFAKSIDEAAQSANHKGKASAPVAPVARPTPPPAKHEDKKPTEPSPAVAAKKEEPPKPPPPPEKTADDFVADAKRLVKTDPKGALDAIEHAQKLNGAIAKKPAIVALVAQAGCAIADAEVQQGKLASAADWLQHEAAPDKCLQHYIDAARKLISAAQASGDLQKGEALIGELEKSAATISKGHAAIGKRAAEAIVGARFDQATALLTAAKPDEAIKLAEPLLARAKKDAPGLVNRITAFLTRARAARATVMLDKANTALAEGKIDEAQALAEKASDLGATKAAALLDEIQEKRESLACDRVKDSVEIGGDGTKGAAALKDAIDSFPDAQCLTDVRDQLIQGGNAGALLDALAKAREASPTLANEPTFIALMTRTSCALTDSAVHDGNLAAAAEGLRRADDPADCTQRYFTAAKDLISRTFSSGDLDKADALIDELEKGVATVSRVRPGILVHGEEALVGAQLDEATALLAQGKEDDALGVAEDAAERARKHAPGMTARASGVLSHVRSVKAATALRKATAALAEGNLNDAEWLARTASDLGNTAARGVQDRVRKAREAAACKHVDELIQQDTRDSDEVASALTDALHESPNADCLKKLQHKLTRYATDAAVKTARDVAGQGELCRAIQMYAAIAPSDPSSGKVAEKLSQSVVNPLVERADGFTSSNRRGASYLLYQAARRCSPTAGGKFDPVKALAAASAEPVRVDVETKGVESASGLKVEQLIQAALGRQLAPMMKIDPGASRKLLVRVEITPAPPQDTVVAVDQVGDASSCAYERRQVERVWTAQATMSVFDGSAKEPLQRLELDSHEVQRAEAVKVVSGSCDTAHMTTHDAAFEDGAKVAQRLDERLAAQLAEQLDIDGGDLVLSEATQRIHDGQDEAAADALADVMAHGRTKQKEQASAQMDQLIGKALQRSVSGSLAAIGQ